MPRSSVLITGATGHVASAMASHFQAEGFEVRALVRSANAAQRIDSVGWSSVVGDLTKRDSLERAVEDIDVVVHAAAYLGSDWDEAQAVNVEGTRLLAQASLDAGVRRFVHISTMGVHGEPLPDALVEDSPLATEDSPYAYVSTKANAELAVRAAGESGLDVVVLRPGAICSAVNSQWGDEFVASLKLNGWPSEWHPDDVIPWVHKDNLCDMTLLAAMSPAAVNQTFFALDRNVAVRDFFVPLANAMGLTVTTPDRKPHVSRSHLGKINAVLGYEARRDFDTTLSQLLALASESRE